MRTLVVIEIFPFGELRVEVDILRIRQQLVELLLVRAA